MTEKFRPHHLFCQRFLKLGFAERGEEYGAVKRRAFEIIGSAEGTLIEVAEGVDQICRVCFNRKGDRCESPKGGDEAVRKWDTIILSGLGVGYGETKTAREWRALIDAKRPLPLCTTRCPYKSDCTVAST